MKRALIIFLTGCLLLLGCNPSKMQQINGEAAKLQGSIEVLRLLYLELYDSIEARQAELLPGDLERLKAIDSIVRAEYSLFQGSLGKIQSGSAGPAMNPETLIQAIIDLTPLAVDLMKGCR